jgi:hypothetical protein
MKLVLAALACAVALAAAAAAAAAPPAGKQQQDPFAHAQPAPFSVVTLTRSEAQSLGVPDEVLPGTVSTLAPAGAETRGGVASPDSVAPCGACINTCWTTTFRTGDNTSTGSYWEYDNPTWCGNGSWITYADISRHWQSVSMWYSADGEAGPWFDGGCAGCVSIHFTLYGYFSWHPPVFPVSHTTIRLGVWMQAYGAAAYG